MANIDSGTDSKNTIQLVRETTTYMHGFTHRLIKDDNAYIPSLKGRRCFHCMSLCRPSFSRCPFCGADLNEPLKSSNYLFPGTLLRRRYLVGELVRVDDACAAYIALDTVNEQVVTLVEYLPLQIVYRPYERMDLLFFNDKDEDLFREGLDEFFRGAKKLATLSCQAVPELLGAFEENGTGYMVTEFFPADSLETFLGQNNCLNAQDTRIIMSSVADALSSIHFLGEVHGAVTPDKILVAADGQAKLVWYGSPNSVVSERKKKVITPSATGYLPEEAYGSTSFLCTASDVYSFAAITYKTLTADPPTHALLRRKAMETKGKDPVSFARRQFMGSEKQVNIASLQNAMHVVSEDRPDDILFFFNELFSAQRVRRKKERIKRVDPLGVRTGGKILVAFAVLLFTGVISLSLVSQLLSLHVWNNAARMQPGSVLSTDVVGDTYQSVEQKWNNRGVRILCDHKIPSSMFEKGTILSQEPMPGERMPYGSILRVVVSSGTEKMIVPDVTGMEYETASALLEAAGFRTDKTEANAPKYNRNVVFKQSLSPGSAADAGSLVELTVSSSSGIYYSSWEITVPDVRNQSLETGMKNLSDKGLYFVVDKYVRDASKKQGVILTQDPPAGTDTKANAVVHITVNQDAEKVCIPDMTHWDFAYAEKRLKDMGFTVSRIDQPSREVSSGAVLRQNIAAGEVVPAGGRILLTVSSGSMETVPDLVGLTYAEARETLYAAYLSSSCVNGENSKKDDKKTVTQQRVHPGEKLPMGSTVEVMLEEPDDH